MIDRRRLLKIAEHPVLDMSEWVLESGVASFLCPKLAGQRTVLAKPVVLGEVACHLILLPQARPCAVLLVAGTDGHQSAGGDALTQTPPYCPCRRVSMAATLVDPQLWRQRHAELCLEVGPHIANCTLRSDAWTPHQPQRIHAPVAPM